MHSCNSPEYQSILDQNRQNLYPFSDQKMRKKKPYPLERHIPKLNYVAYTRDGTPGIYMKLFIVSII